MPVPKKDVTYVISFFCYCRKFVIVV